MKFLLISLTFACLLSCADSVSLTFQLTAGDASTCSTINQGWAGEQKAEVACMNACETQWKNFQNCTRSRCFAYNDGRTECGC
ncbi:hypothetical protein PENTCL1PPCAC_20182, partial [Pristionchus entomophagus]